MSLQLYHQLRDSMASLLKTEAQTVEEQLKVVIKQMETVSLDCYNNILLCLFTGNQMILIAKDSTLFINTISKLENVEVCI